MADDYLVVSNLGAKGVNVDSSPLHKEDNQFLKAQNLISDPLGVEIGLKNRPGLLEFNTEDANGAILGGTNVPLTNILTGSHMWFIGRGPKS